MGWVVNNGDDGSWNSRVGGDRDNGGVDGHYDYRKDIRLRRGHA